MDEQGTAHHETPGQSQDWVLVHDSHDAIQAPWCARHVSPGADPAPPGVEGAGLNLSMLRAVVVAARQEAPEGDEAMWLLVDLLEPLDPVVTGWDLDVADAVLLLFSEIGLGPTGRQLTWLRWAQKATVTLLGPADPRTCEANTAVGRLCFSLGRYDEAAAAWQALITVHEQHGHGEAADEVRVDWAVCLYAVGRCTEAVTALQQAWSRWKQNPVNPLTGATISGVCIEMLSLCCRRHEAQAMRPDVDDRLPSFFRYGGPWTETVRAPYPTALSAREHGQVCAYRPGIRTASAAHPRPA